MTGGEIQPPRVDPQTRARELIELFKVWGISFKDIGKIAGWMQTYASRFNSRSWAKYTPGDEMPEKAENQN